MPTLQSAHPSDQSKEQGLGRGFAVFGEDGDAGIAVGEGLNVELGAGHAVAGDVAVEAPPRRHRHRRDPRRFDIEPFTHGYARITILAGTAKPCPTPSSSTDRLGEQPQFGIAMRPQPVQLGSIFARSLGPGYRLRGKVALLCDATSAVHRQRPGRFIDEDLRD